MKKIGEILKTERENRGLSLHEIGMSLKINPKILKAIEDGDEKNLPAKTFLRGFIRSYAQYLRLDVEDILRLFQDEVGSTRPPEPKAETESTQIPTPIVPVQTAAPTQPIQEPKPAKVAQEKPLRKPTDESLNPKSSNRMLTIIGAIVLVLLIAFVAKMVEKYQKEAARPEDQMATTTTLPNPTPESATAPNVNESVPPGEAPLSSGAAAVATTLPQSSEVMTAAPIKSTTTTTSTTVKVTTTTVRPTTTTVKAVVAAPVRTTTTSTSTSTTTSTVKTTTTTMKTTTTTTTIPGKKAFEVIVEALNNVSIKYTMGDGAPETLDMTADQVHTFKGKGKITLEVSDGGAISVIVNGRDRGVPGTIGQPTKLTYP